jgi:amphi-Trp domain-containing protein
MTSEEVELDFGFSNEELANFMENFSQKLRDGEIGLSFKGREELEIEPNMENNINIEFREEGSMKEMKLELHLREQNVESNEDSGRQRIQVVVED